MASRIGTVADDRHPPLVPVVRPGTGCRAAQPPSLAGVLFEAYFLYLELFVIGAVCVWCTSYGLSLVLRFVIALWVWLRGNPSVVTEPPPR
jgi:uncharacterized membrane protein